MDDLDFSYRNETLADHGFMLCSFDNISSATKMSSDSQRTYSSISMFGGKRQPVLYFTYNDTLSIQMQICKLPDAEEKLISPAEAAEIKRWLGSPFPQELFLGEEKYQGYLWEGVFNIEEIHYAFGCIGFDLTFISSAPFGYKERVELYGSVSANNSVTIYDTSDEEGYIYPDMEITVLGDGDLRITNSYDNRQTVILGCTSGEVISFSNLLQVVSSNTNHVLGNDFNYKFVRINNSYKNTLNRLTFNLPCEYKITYKPIAKVVFT